MSNSTFNKKEFQRLLKEAIGPDTNSSFAKKAGVSRVYLQTLLSEKASAPSWEYTMKLFEVARDRIDEIDFLIAAGYENVLSPGDRRRIMNKEEWCELNIAEVKQFFGEWLFRHPFTKPEFADIFKNFYSTARSETEINLGEETPIKESDTYEDTMIPVEFIWTSERLKIEHHLKAELFGHHSQVGALYITDMRISKTASGEIDSRIIPLKK